MSGVGRRVFGLCLPPLLICALDIMLTLLGQSGAYWGGDYQRVNEASSTFNHLLQIHPAAFIAGTALWMAVFVGLILLLPDTLALIVSIAVAFGHTVGTATWLLWRFAYGYQAVNGLLLAVAALLGIGIRWGWRAAPSCQYGFHGWSSRLRWAIIAVLVALGAYLFLWPRMT